MTLQLSYYADDFTGATDSLEVLATRGIRTMLFLEPPSKALLEERYPDLACVGIAGTSRAMTPAAMERELGPLLHRLKQLDAPIMHYKICSTCDSSPQIGSVGKVMEMVKPWFPAQSAIPLLAAAPQLGRYTVFGQHYAVFGGHCYRLDRHPVMSRHPATPMTEADLTIHFSRQTDLTIAGLSLTELDSHPNPADLHRAISGKSADVIVLDAYHPDHMRQIGQWLWAAAQSAPQFVVGSSGVQLALAESWPAGRSATARPAGPPPPTQPAGAAPVSPGNAGPMLVLSGSCSAVTHKQIERAIAAGFVGVKLDTDEIIADPEATDRIAREAAAFIRGGRSVVAYTAAGPDDPDIARTGRSLQRLSPGGLHNSGEILGAQLGRIGKRVVEQTGLRRMAIAGGDTSGFAAKEMGIDALEMIWPAAPGAPLCRCHSQNESMHGLELALKGGQLGQEDYFGRLL